MDYFRPEASVFFSSILLNQVSADSCKRCIIVVALILVKMIYYPTDYTRNEVLRNVDR